MSATSSDQQACRKASDSFRSLARESVTCLTAVSYTHLGIALGKDDKLISLSILRHVEATSDERSAYLKMRRAMAGEGGDEAVETEAEEVSEAAQISQERYVEMSAHEQVVLTVSVNGYGKRTSSYG